MLDNARFSISSLLSALWWLHVTYIVNHIVDFCVKLCITNTAFFALSFTCICLIWEPEYCSKSTTWLFVWNHLLEHSATFFCSLLYVSCIFSRIFLYFSRSLWGMKFTQRRPRVRKISFLLSFHCAQLQPWSCRGLHRIETKMALRRCAKMWKNESFPEILQKVIDRKYFHRNFLNDLHIGDNFCLLGKVNIFYCRKYFRHFYIFSQNFENAYSDFWAFSVWIRDGPCMCIVQGRSRKVSLLSGTAATR